MKLLLVAEMICRMGQTMVNLVRFDTLPALKIIPDVTEAAVNMWDLSVVLGLGSSGVTGIVTMMVVIIVIGAMGVIFFFSRR